MKTRQQLLDDIEHAMEVALQLGFSDPKPLLKIIDEIRVIKQTAIDKNRPDV